MKNLKKVISSVAALTIVASSASAFAVTFPDVEASATYAKAVDTLSALNIVNGDDNGLFNPDNKVTRAEFTKMAVEALGEGASATAQTVSRFNDAANTTQHWAAGYIAQGVSDGWINGYDDTTFGPDDQVTFAQACKMLTAMIGYTAYAEQLGGYPAGYVNQASSTGITSGVKANNDDQLTRAQVAMLIANALDVPLVTNEYEAAWNGSLVATPKKLDGKEGRDYQTLLTDKHNAYVVKGRVTVTAKGGSASGLEKDEVKYQVEVSDNFDDTLDITKGENEELFKVGDTNAADMLFEYTEAIVQKDEDTDEYTILSITQYGNSKTVEAKADDVADDDSTIGTDYVGKGKLPVYKSESSKSTTKYDIDADTVVYVNGVKAAKVSNDLIEKYIINNPTGKVTLVDATEIGSTSTDGTYDYIMIDYYVDAVIDSVQESSTNVKIHFKNSQNGVNRMQWDPEDEDIDITFTLDGAKIAYTDLQEYDVLSIAYDVVANEGQKNLDLEYYDVKVSRNKINGVVSSRDTEDDTIRVDGNDYEVVEGLVDVTSDVELSTSYDLYLDAFGYVAYVDEGQSEKSYGVIVAMYQSAGNDQPTVRMITSDAQVVAYECKDATEAKKFYNYATTGDATGNAAVEEFTKTTLADRIKAGDTVCEYKLSGGKLKFDKVVQKFGEAGLEYKANQQKLGSFSLSESVTKFIDMDGYMNGGDTTVGTLTLASLEDEATYTAYMYGKNNNGDYRFAMILDGTSSIRSESTVAVVAAINGTKDEDGTTCTEVKVARDDQDDVVVLFEGDDTGLQEGDIIAYVVGSDGYVETGKCYTIYSPASSYDGMKDIYKETNFINALNKDNVSILADGRYAGLGTPAYAKSASKDVVLYFGPVYKKTATTVDIFTAQTDGQSSTIKDLKSLSLAGANSYVYDYNGQKKYKVMKGSTNQGDKIYKQTFVDGNNTIVSWDKVIEEGVNPTFAFVKEVDGDVIDVVYFVAP